MYDAICIKVFPRKLMKFPAWKRPNRCLYPTIDRLIEVCVMYNLKLHVLILCMALAWY